MWDGGVKCWKIKCPDWCSCTDQTGSWSSDDNKLVEFFKIHMLLIPFRLVLVLQYLTNLSFMILSSLVRRHDRSFVVHLLEPAINRCRYGMVIYATWESSTDMTDFYLPQTILIPLMWWTGCDFSRLFPMSHLLGYMLGYCCLHCLFPILWQGCQYNTSCTQLSHYWQLCLRGPKHNWHVIYGGCLWHQVDQGLDV